MSIRRMYLYRIKSAKGLTLIELLVSVALSLMVVGIAVVALMGAGFSMRNVAATTSLTDTSMIVTTALQRVAQAGYQPPEGQFTRENYYYKYTKKFPAKPYPDVYGFSASKLTGSGSLGANHIDDFYSGSGSGPLAVAANLGHDMLAIRFQAIPERLNEKAGMTAMLNLCTGETLETNPYKTTYTPNELEAEIYKPLFIFHVGKGKTAAEDVLYCDYFIESSTSGSKQGRQPIIDGVIAFKVMYGVSPKNSSGAPLNWKTADEIKADSDKQLWQKVKRIRFGMILKTTHPNAAGVNSGENVILYPLGPEYSQASNKLSKVDLGTYDPSVIYRVVNFTVDVNNALFPVTIQ